MARLGEVATAIKSANAGATWLTFDIVFADQGALEEVCDSGLLVPALFGRLFNVDPGEVRVHRCDAVRTVKATIPRTASKGGPEETDFDGVQQFIPLLDIEVPIASNRDVATES
jgi:Domain of unknown function (DUF4387)